MTASAEVTATSSSVAVEMATHGNGDAVKDEPRKQEYQERYAQSSCFWDMDVECDEEYRSVDVLMQEALSVLETVHFLWAAASTVTDLTSGVLRWKMWT